MAIVQSKISAAAGATSLGLSFDTLPTIGRRIVVAAACWINTDGDNMTCADNQGHSYGTPRWAVDTSASGNINGYAVWDVIVSASSGTFTVTVSKPNSGDITVCILESDAANTYDTHVFDTGSTGGVTVSKSITAGQSNVELIAVMTHDWSNNPADVAEGGGFTLIREFTNNNTACGLYLASKSLGASGVHTPSWTWNDAGSHAAVIGILSYYDVAAGGQPFIKRIKTVPGMGRGFTGYFGVR